MGILFSDSLDLIHSLFFFQVLSKKYNMKGGRAKL
jgi:hypothetical protein